MLWVYIAILGLMPLILIHGHRCVYSKEIINMVLDDQVSGLAENFSIRIFSDTINVINIQLCMTVSLIELHPP